MSENYRDMLYLARLTGEAVKLPYEAHCREALLDGPMSRFSTN